jgi:outer membrane protein
VLGGLGDVDRDRFGPVAQAGFDIPLGKAVLLNFDAKKIWLDTDVTGVVSGNMKVDPWVYGVGLGFRF